MSFELPSFSTLCVCALLTWGAYRLHRGRVEPDHMANLLHGKLVTCASGGLQGYSDQQLAQKKYFGLYYSASWCPGCRQTTPRLVDFYRQIEVAHPELEIVFISADRSPQEMQTYIDQERMPWAALVYGLKGQETELMHYHGDCIPDLEVVDGSGNVVASSFRHGRYVGPFQAMNDLRDVLGP